MRIKNINLEKSTILKINDKSIEIENLGYPKIKIYNSMIECNFDNFEEIDNNTLEQFKLYTIDKEFKVSGEQIKSRYRWLYNIFSVYLIFKNEIIIKKVGKYNFEKLNRRIFYGYSVENYYNNYYSIFGAQKRNKFMSVLENYKIELSSNNLIEVNRCISNIISQQINIS